MTIRPDDTNSLYGFGALPKAQTAAACNSTCILSLFVIALSTAVLALLFVAVPTSSADASPLITQASETSRALGLTATLGFAASTIAAGILLVLAPAISRRRTRQRNA